jgi:hypothetical protein
LQYDFSAVLARFAEDLSGNRTAALGNINEFTRVLLGSGIDAATLDYDDFA